MGLRIGEIGEKRLLGFGLALDEIDGVVGDFAIDRRALARPYTSPCLGF